jgi:hypothetical protein
MGDNREAKTVDMSDIVLQCRDRMSRDEQGDIENALENALIFMNMVRHFSPTGAEEELSF